MSLRKIIVVFVLMVHINGSMLMPQVAEVDVFDARGRQTDDINSVIEYIDQVVLGNEDITPEDEDNDDGQNLHLVKACDYSIEIFTTVSRKKTFPPPEKRSFHFFRDKMVISPSIDVIAPPPKA